MKSYLLMILSLCVATKAFANVQETTENGVYLAAGGGVFPGIGFKAGIKQDFGSLEFAYGIGNALMMFSDGSFSFLYKTPDLAGFTLRAGPALSFSTYTVDSYAVGRDHCSSCDSETIGYSRMYEYGLEAGIGWERSVEKLPGRPTFYFEVDLLHAFFGLGSFERREQAGGDADEWALAKKQMDEHREDYKRRDQVIHRLGSANFGVKISI